MKLTYIYPIALTFLGVVIHASALIGYSFGVTPTSLHWTMLLIDTLVCYGLIKKSKWGYILAILLYLQQGVFQTYWAVQAFLNKWDMWELQVTASILCLVSLMALGFSRSIYFKNLKTKKVI